MGYYKQSHFTKKATLMNQQQVFTPVFTLKSTKFNKKTDLLGSILLYTLAVPTGKEPVKRNYLPTDFELILSLVRCFSCKDLLILRWDTETVKQLMVDFVKVETNVHSCHK
jgi:hypothetical protein